MAIITINVECCRQLNLDLVPRLNNELVDVSNVSPIELFNIHQESGKHLKMPSVRFQLTVVGHMQLGR